MAEPAQDNLHRSETDKIVGGVAGGLGEYFQIDSTLIRLIFVFLTVFGGSGIILYLILWFIIPSQGSERSFNLGDKEHLRAKVHQFAHDLRGGSNPRSRIWLGFVLIVIGLLFFANSLGLFYSVDLNRFWPLILILLGISLLGKR